MPRRTITYRKSATLDANNWKTLVAPVDGVRLRLFSFYVSRDTSGNLDYAIRWSGGREIAHRNGGGGSGTPGAWMPDAAGGYDEGPIGEGLEVQFPAGMTADATMHVTVATNVRGPGAEGE